jgi:hypothetical protein
VRVFGADLLTVHVQLNLAEAARPGAPLAARSSSGEEQAPGARAFPVSALQNART